MSKRITRIVTWGILLGLTGLTACESTGRTETAQSFTGQAPSERTPEPEQKPATHRLAVKGLNGPV